MKIWMHYNSVFFKLPLLRNYEAIVLGYHVFFKRSYLETTRAVIEHELVHIRQINQYGIFKFYLTYIRDYLKNLWKYRNHEKAYLNIPFEIEAYEAQKNFLQGG